MLGQSKKHMDIKKTTLLDKYFMSAYCDQNFVHFLFNHN